VVETLLTKDELLTRMKQIEAEHGPWSSHDIYLGHGVYTTREEWHGPHPRSHKIVQAISDFVNPDLSKVRVLDLGCLEGLLAIECALYGCEAVGIEVRSASLAKANFAREALGLSRLSFHQDDALNISKEKYGEFDVILCCGLFYHFDAPDLIPFLRTIRSMCTSMFVLDTHFAYEAKEAFDWEGRAYLGYSIREFPDHVSDQERIMNLWASFRNIYSFVPTKVSLFNMLHDVGFTSVIESIYPVHSHLTQDRTILLAMNGRRFPPLNWPGRTQFANLRLPDVDNRPCLTDWPHYGPVDNPITRKLETPFFSAATTCVEQKKGGSPIDHHRLLSGIIANLEEHIYKLHKQMHNFVTKRLLSRLRRLFGWTDISGY
jgi:SAM-dependent methyltransferase